MKKNLHFLSLLSPCHYYDHDDGRDHRSQGNDGADNDRCDGGNDQGSRRLNGDRLAPLSSPCCRVGPHLDQVGRVLLQSRHYCPIVSDGPQLPLPPQLTRATAGGHLPVGYGVECHKPLGLAQGEGHPE